MRVITQGTGRPVIGIIGRLHGNEPLGEEVIDILSKIQLKTKMVYLVANEEAGKANQRFIDVDLNRCFPGKDSGNHEERLAARILKELKQCDYVIDIHSTSSQTEGFIIMTDISKVKWSLANSLPISKVVIMQGALAKGSALIDYVDCGVSIEFSNKVSPKDVVELLRKFIEQIESDRLGDDKKEVFEVYDTLKDSKKHYLENFKDALINGESFVPILFGEKAYKDIACLKARRITREEILKRLAIRQC